MKINIEETKNYVDPIIPAGNYQVEVLKAEDKKTMNGDSYINLALKIVDTIPSGQPFDEDDSYIDAVAEESIVYKSIYDPAGSSEKWMRDNATRCVQSYLLNFEIDPLNDDELVAADFENTVGGIKISNVHKDRKDTSSPMVHRVDDAVAII